MKWKAKICILGGWLCAMVSFGQEINARYGWYLPTSGELRVLVIFAEIEYDVKPQLDPHLEGTPFWMPGKLPAYKDRLFDPYWKGQPQAEMTKYYAECSFNQFKVLGDYINEVVTIKESEVDINNFYQVKEKIRKKLNARGELRTNAKLSVADFDLWKKCNRPGAVKVKGSDTPYQYDHVMLFLRNYHRWGRASGSTAPGTFRALYGYESNTHSQFTGGSHFPFSIVRHEFNHMLFGGNNFHVGGGLGAGAGYFIPSQGGWSMLGGANSSFLTCNAWDRRRFGWKPKGAKYGIRCKDGKGKVINSDISEREGQFNFVIRDFVSTGDAIRIKLPGLSDKVFQQWIWIENHQLKRKNNSVFDRFQYDDNECVAGPVPGIYMYLQVAKEDSTGSNTFKGHGDYLRPIPADGCYDYLFEWEAQQQNACVNSAMYTPFEKKKKWENPLTGNQDMEIPAYDLDSNGNILKKEQVFLAIEGASGVYAKRLFWLGHERHAFTPNGINVIGTGTNPSTASMMTLVSENGPLRTKRNNRQVVINGLRIEIGDQLKDGSILISVRFDQPYIWDHARWCADTIVVPPGRFKDSPSLVLQRNARLTLERSRTATRIRKPDKEGNHLWYAGKTNMVCRSGSSVELMPSAKITLKEGSQLKISKGASFKIHGKCEIHVREGKMLIEDGADVQMHRKAVIHVSSKGELDNQTDKKLVRKKWLVFPRKGRYFLR